MNYTEKHHLPQWEETDRIMRTDFNQMCADIEEGLNEANASAASALDASETAVLARLRRIGYDLCQVNARSLAAGAEGIPHAKGLACNGLASAAERAKTSGLFLPEDSPGGWLGPQTGMTLERLNAGVYSRSNGTATATYTTATATVCFRSKYQGTITGLDIWFHHELAVSAAPTMQVKLYDLDAESYAYQSEPAKVTAFGSGDHTRTLTLAVPLEARKNYRMEVFLNKDSIFKGTVGIGAEDGADLTGTVEPILNTTGTVSASLKLESPACLAVAVAHCTGGSAAPTMKVAGMTMTAGAARQGISVRGGACTEREYYLEGNWSGTVNLSAAFQSTTDMVIHDVEWYLI